jgi:hypothetical protein
MQDEKTTNKKESKKFSNRKLENRKFENRSCLCDKKHSFSYCYYLIKNIHSTEWKWNDEIIKSIEKIFESNSRVRNAIKYVCKNFKKRLKNSSKRKMTRAINWRKSNLRTTIKWR